VRTTRRWPLVCNHLRQHSGCKSAVPDAFDFGDESATTLARYGLQPGQTSGFGWQCLAARRSGERGVWFVELIDTGFAGNWDAHGDMMTHAMLAKNVDQSIAALLTDLKQCGLLDETLVVWTAELGRTPYNNTAEAKGREHHPWAFSSWLARASNRASCMVPVMKSECGPWISRFTFMIVMPRSCT